MNIANIDKAIAVMERAKLRGSVFMETWQANQLDWTAPIKHTEEQFHTCGNTACFAGHIAISPEFIADGGSAITSSGEPRLVIGVQKLYSSEAIGTWLDLYVETAELLIYNQDHNVIYDVDQLTGDYESETLFSSEFVYGVKWEDVKAEHVLAVLRELRDMGEEAFQKRVREQFQKKCKELIGEDVKYHVNSYNPIFFNTDHDHGTVTVTPD